MFSSLYCVVDVVVLDLFRRRNSVSAAFHINATSCRILSLRRARRNSFEPLINPPSAALREIYIRSERLHNVRNYANSRRQYIVSSYNATLCEWALFLAEKLLKQNFSWSCTCCTMI